MIESAEQSYIISKEGYVTCYNFPRNKETFDVTGDITGDVTGDCSGHANQLIDQGGGNDLKFKVVNIGDWNMDADAAISVTLTGLTNIRGVVGVTILNDAGTLEIDLNYSGSYSFAQVGALRLVGLTRTGGGTFDNTDYNATTYNRGYITVCYQP